MEVERLKPTTRDWLEIAADEVDVAQAMCDAGRYLYAAFMTQQSAEKALNVVIQESVDFPLKIHDLEILAERPGLTDPALTARLRVSAFTTWEVLEWATRRLNSMPS
ncbi:MAG: HEPN domain-containing protein [Clostridiales bacterium]|nr:HEPN domain-containing protein [Clostridiales bacterium]MBT9259736.1 HEPN domain-containing protein [Clostridiales bacterium]